MQKSVNRICKLKYKQFLSYLLSTLFLFPFHLFFPGAPNRIFLLFLPWLPCHFYLVVIEQQQQQQLTIRFKLEGSAIPDAEIEPYNL